jgi:flagellar protein FliO/FliZ
MGTTVPGNIDWLRIGGSIALVFVLLLTMLWVLRRLRSMQIAKGGMSKLEIVETISVGPRQKIALLRVEQHMLLIGMSANQFTALGQWQQAKSNTGDMS